MPFDGSGIYSPPGLPVFPPSAGAVISSSYYTQVINDISSALSLTFLRDGSVPYNADFNLNVHKLIGIADGTAGSPALQFSSDSDTGFYLSANGKLAFAIGGVKIAEFTATGLMFAAAAPVALTDAATVAVDFAAGVNFSLLATAGVGATRQLGNPSNVNAGQSGIITYTQDGTGSRAITFASNWHPQAGLVASIAAGTEDIFSYYAETPTKILVGISKGY